MAIPQNPVSAIFDRMFDQAVRSRFFQGLDFAEPKGDPGWFGPDSAVWFVHSHMPLVALGLFSSATMEQLDPSTISGGYHHSRALKRDDDGNPRFAIDPEGAAVRSTTRWRSFSALPTARPTPRRSARGSSGPCTARCTG